jgi:hypothetical protein
VTPPTLTADEVPLVLLSATAHPDVAFRAHLARRLDDALEARRPLQHEHKVRAFLARQHGTPLEPFALDPLTFEMAVRLLRLVFANSTPKVGRRRLRIVSCEVFDDNGGLIVSPQLKSQYLERFALGQGRGRVMRWAAHFVAGWALGRLVQFSQPGRTVRAVCRAQDGYRVIVRGELPWKGVPVYLAGASTLGKRRLSEGSGLEIVGAPDGGTMVRTTTPESVIRFSAALARGEQLTLRPNLHPCPGRVVIGLRDFECDEAELPVVVSYADSEPWLRGAPALPLGLDLDERVAIARWLYPVEPWVTDDFLERLR